MAGDDNSAGQPVGETAGNPSQSRRDPLADYVMSPQERAARPVDSPESRQAVTSQERIKAEMEAARRQLAGTPYPTVEQQPFAPLAPGPAEPAVWPPPVYGQQPARSFDPLLSITPYRPTTTVARIATGLYGFLVFICAVAIAAALMGVPPMALLLLNLIRAASELFAWIALVVWMYQAYANLGSFQAGGLKSTPTGAVVSWFIPFLSIYRPWQVMTEIWQASDPSVRIDPLRPTAWQMSMTSPMVTLWWLTYFLPLVVIFAEIGRSFAASATYYAGLSLTTAISAVMTILLVNAASARQDEKAATLYR